MTVRGALVPLGQGITVGAAVGLVYAVLGLISQCASVTGTRTSIPLYGYMVCLGAILSATLHLSGFSGVGWGIVFLPAAALLAGMYLGIVLSALVEVLNIFPAISGKLKLAESMRLMVVSLAVGKALGVAVYYITPIFATK